METDYSFFENSASSLNKIRTEMQICQRTLQERIRKTLFLKSTQLTEVLEFIDGTDRRAV
jgi:hypothetical protein